jgi:Flp pilus assembly protein TadD
MQQPVDAEREFRAALELENAFVPAYINLADLYRAQNMSQAALQTLQTGLEKAPDSGALHHSLGLAQFRQGQETVALASLTRAAELEPSNARFAYVSAIALNSAGQSQDALNTLEAAHQRHPGNAEILFALATINRDMAQKSKAEEWAGKLLALDPGNEQARSLLDSLEEAQ